MDHVLPSTQEKKPSRKPHAVIDEVGLCTSSGPEQKHNLFLKIKIRSLNSYIGEFDVLMIYLFFSSILYSFNRPSNTPCLCSQISALRIYRVSAK